MRKGNSPNSRNGLDRGVWVPGVFELEFSENINRFESLVWVNAVRCEKGRARALARASRKRRANGAAAGRPVDANLGFCLGLGVNDIIISKMIDTNEFLYLGHSNWTICGLVS